MTEENIWETFFDMDAETFHRHAGFISLRTLSQKRAEEILETALKEGLAGMSKTDPSCSKWCIWEYCNRIVSTKSQAFIDPETAKQIVLEFCIP